MEFVEQALSDVISALGPLRVDWQDDTARRVMEKFESFPIKPSYDKQDLRALLEENFDDAMLICRLFLCLSKDAFTTEIGALTGSGKGGLKGFREDPEAFVSALIELGVADSMALEVNRQHTWSDRVVDRLRTMRGSAISGQKRGRGLEDLTQAVVKVVFDDQFEMRCTFSGVRGRTAKCDFAIPGKNAPRVVIEAKGYGATGSKMSDIIGDIDAIKNAKRPDTSFLFITDGLSWQQRKSDLQKIVDRQNNGEITRIYTTSMFGQLEADLRTLKHEYGL